MAAAFSLGCDNPADVGVKDYCAMGKSCGALALADVFNELADLPRKTTNQKRVAR